MNKLKLLTGTTLIFILPLALISLNQVAFARVSGCSRVHDTSSNSDEEICIDIHGKGLEVGSVVGSFDLSPGLSESTQPPTICNWKYDIAFIPDDGSTTSIAPGPVHNSCDTQGKYVKDYIAEHRQPYIAKRGKVCAKLYKDYDTYVDAACEDITP